MQSLLSTHVDKVHALEVHSSSSSSSSSSSTSSSSHSIHEVGVEGKSDDDNYAMSEDDEGELSKGNIIEVVRTMAGTIHSEGK